MLLAEAFGLFCAGGLPPEQMERQHKKRSAAVLRQGLRLGQAHTLASSSERPQEALTGMDPQVLLLTD